MKAMPIATIRTVVKVTPEDDLQILQGKNKYDLLADRTPFKVRVAEVIRENDVVIGISGPVIDGHPRYHGLIATLLTRLDDSRWESEVRSSVNFKVGPTVARRVTQFPHGHPDGTVIDSYPVIVRYGRIEAEA